MGNTIPVLLNYLTLCIVALFAFPLSLLFVVFTLGVGLLAVPFLIVTEAEKYEALAIPAWLGIMTYLGFLLFTVLRKHTIWSAIMFALLSCFSTYLVVAVSAEISWRWAMAQDAEKQGLKCIEPRQFIALRARKAGLALHSDERMFYTPHATASKDGKLFIWSFGETRFVEWEDYGASC